MVMEVWPTFYQKLKNNYLAAFLCLLVLASFGWHFYHRNQHFQECDSTVVYQVIHDFPKSVIVNAAAASGGGNFLSESTVQKILNIGLVKNLRVKYFSNIGEEEIIQRITSLKPTKLARLVVRTFLISLPLPYFVQVGLTLPFSSTYSFGSGLIYGLVTHRDMSYDNFMSVAMVVSQVLFHLSVLILFFISLKLGLKPISAVFASLLMLFSISMYSYGYHLGNTVWNYATSFLWVLVLIYYWRDGGYGLLKKISLVTAILIFFNYLIIFYWLAFLMAYIYLNWQKEPSLKRSLILNSKFLIRVIKSQWLAILAVFAVAGLFYPPGQGNRGTTSISTFLSDCYYIVLNFFSFYNHSQLIDVLQFILGLVLIVGTLFYIFRPDRFDKKSEIIVLKKTFGFLIIIFAVLAIFGVLGFAPSRHILFLSPVVFIFSAILAEKWLFKYLHQWLSFAVLAMLVILGVVGLYLRSMDVNSLAKKIIIPDDKDIKAVVVQDCAVDLVFKNWPTAIPVDYAKPFLFNLGATYLYLSPTIPFNQALSDWQWPELKHPTEIKAEVLSDFYAVKNVYFTAYNPRHFYNHWPNSIHQVKFKVTSVKVKK